MKTLVLALLFVFQVAQAQTIEQVTKELEVANGVDVVPKEMRGIQLEPQPKLIVVPPAPEVKKVESKVESKDEPTIIDDPRHPFTDKDREYLRKLGVLKYAELPHAPRITIVEKSKTTTTTEHSRITYINSDPRMAQNDQQQRPSDDDYYNAVIPDPWR